MLASRQISEGVHTIEAGGQSRAGEMSVRAARGGGGGDTDGTHHDSLVPCLAALNLALPEPTGMKKMAAREAMRARDEEEFYAQAKQVSKVRDMARQLAAARAAELEREVERRRERFLYNPAYASAPLAPKERKHSDALALKEASLAQQEELQDQGPSVEPPLPPNVYVVDAILDERQRRGKLQYLVKWQGYDNPEDNTWEDAENVTWGAQGAIKAYEEVKKRYTGVRVTYKNPHGW